MEDRPQSEDLARVGRAHACREPHERRERVPLRFSWTYGRGATAPAGRGRPRITLRILTVRLPPLWKQGSSSFRKSPAHSAKRV